MRLVHESILGTLWRLWCDSGTCRLLRRIWRFVCLAFSGSLVFRLAFGRTALDRLFVQSRFSRLTRRGVDTVVALLRRPAVRAAAWLGPVFRSSRVLRFDTLYSCFLCIMFVVPHSGWNNLWAVAAALVFLAAYLLRCAAGVCRVRYPEALGLGMALFCLSCVLSLLFTSDLADSFRILLFFLSAFVFCYLIAANFDTPTALRKLMGFLYVSLLVVSCVGIMQRALHLVHVNASFTDVNINQGVPGRIYATLDNPNNFSGFLQLFLPLGAAYVGGSKPGWGQWLRGLGLLLPLTAMVMTYARAGWIAIALAALVFTYCCNRKAVPVLILLVLVAVPLMPQSVLTRLSTITNAEDSSANHRLAIWEGVLALLGDRGYWLTGIGLGPKTFQVVYPPYATGAGIAGAYHSQMLYMELDLELGVLGFAAFLWMMLKYSGRIGRAIAGDRDRKNRLVLAAAISTIVALAFSGIVEYLWFYQRCIFAFFIFLGVALAALGMAEARMGEPFPEAVE